MSVYVLQGQFGSCLLKCAKWQLVGDRKSHWEGHFWSWEMSLTWTLRAKRMLHFCCFVYPNHDMEVHNCAKTALVSFCGYPAWHTKSLIHFGLCPFQFIIVHLAQSAPMMRPRLLSLKSSPKFGVRLINYYSTKGKIESEKKHAEIIRAHKWKEIFWLDFCLTAFFSPCITFTFTRCTWSRFKSITNYTCT